MIKLNVKVLFICTPEEGSVKKMESYIKEKLTEGFELDGPLFTDNNMFCQKMKANYEED